MKLQTRKYLMAALLGAGLLSGCAPLVVGGAGARLRRETDGHVCGPHERAARVREVQQLVLHCLCDGIDTQLLGEQEPM